MIRTSERRWYIWYTRPRAEKKVRERLEAKDIEVFLPLRKELKQWSDRKKLVETPLFSGYIFASVEPAHWDAVAYTEGLLTYVKFGGKPAYLYDSQVQQIQAALACDELDVEPVYAKGEMVEVVSGPLQGMQGELVYYRGSDRLAIRIEQLDKILLVHLPKSAIKSLYKA